MIENKMGDRHALAASLEFAPSYRASLCQIIVKASGSFEEYSVQEYHLVVPMVVSRPLTTQSTGWAGEGGCNQW